MKFLEVFFSAVLVASPRKFSGGKFLNVEYTEFNNETLFHWWTESFLSLDFNDTLR